MSEQPQQQIADAAGAPESSALLEQLALAVAEERSRLARELHDTVAQSLAALVQKLDQVGEPRAEIVEARALAHQALEEIRRAVWGLRPALLEALPLHEALAREVEQIADEAGLSSRVTLVGQPRPLLPQQEMALFRIAQEALSNTIRHAAARRVRVTLAYAEQEVQLSVEDDGRGFEPAALEAARFPGSAAWPPYFEQPGGASGAGSVGHFGLQSMRERAHLVGGWLKLESAPGQGTRVLVTLPYSPLAAAPGVAVLPSVKEPVQPVLGASVAGLLPAARQTSMAQPGQTTVPAGRIRVLIVDDHAMTRVGIRRLLENYPDIEIVGEAADGLEALAEAQDLGPQVILMDRRMAGMDGLEALRQLRASNRDVKVLMVSALAQDEDVLESLKAGASGYVLKDVTPDELASAVRAVVRGEALLSPGLTGKLIDRFGRGTSAEQQMTLLTGREQEVLHLLASGLRNKEMARQLQVSERTVTFHLANIYQKLGVTSRTEALSRALELGLLNSGATLAQPRLPAE
jgi:DNA-binding NarL/FixJ family response regulator/two-component sensor histidine kinase